MLFTLTEILNPMFYTSVTNIFAYTNTIFKDNFKRIYMILLKFNLKQKCKMNVWAMLFLMNHTYNQFQNHEHGKDCMAYSQRSHKTNFSFYAKELRKNQ